MLLLVAPLAVLLLLCCCRGAVASADDSLQDNDNKDSRYPENDLFLSFYNC